MTGCREPAGDRSRIDAARQEQPQRAIGNQAELDRFVEQCRVVADGHGMRRPVAMHVQPIGREIDLETVAIRQPVNVREDGSRRGDVAMRKVGIDRLGRECAAVARQPWQHGANERAECEAVVIVRVDERLQAHAVAHDVQALRAKIDDREGEHAAQPRQQPIDAPRLVAAQDELGVARRVEAHVARLERPRIGLPAVDLAVVRDPDRPVVVAHGLVRDRTRIDDRQSRVHERRGCQRVVGKARAVDIEYRVVLRVRSAAAQRIAHPRADIRFARPAEVASDAAHR